MTDETIENPGLAPFELSDYRGIEGINYYDSCELLKRHLKNVIPSEDYSAVDEHMRSFGALAAGEINRLVNACHKEGKYGQLVKYDRHGNRIDEIEYSAEQIEAKRLAYEAGLVNLDLHPEWKRPFYFDHREALAYVSNMNGEAGYNCPLAMTEGMIEILHEVGTEEQKKKYLPLVTSLDAKYFFTAGQFLTERVGGSNLGANRTVARKGENGKWYLTGEKWFCSNPSEIWVTTAKIENSDSIGAFIVTRFKENGELNNTHLLRLKDIIGSRGKVTAEAEYRETEAELLGRPHTGLALLIRYVINVSRAHVALSAVGAARRAYWEARAYAHKRKAFGKDIFQFSSIKRSLASMQVLLCAMESVIFDNWQLKQKKSPLFDLMTPLMKYIGSSKAVTIGHEAIMIHGGNGILADYSVLPRLLNDSVINETWEGTHNIIAGHTMKAWRKNKPREEYLRQVKEGLVEFGGDLPKTKAALKAIESDLTSVPPGDVHEVDRLPFCEKIFQGRALLMLGKIAIEEKKSENSQLYTDLAEGFADFCESGFYGFTGKDSLFRDEERMMRLIEFS